MPQPSWPWDGSGVRVWLLSGRERPAGLSGDDVLDAGERARAATFRFDVDAERYRRAHQWLRVLLGGATGRRPEDLVLRRAACPRCGGPHGRPELAGPAGLHFSLSHAGDLVAVAVAAVPVGVDVEVGPADASVSAALHPEEVRLLRELPAADRDAAFLQTWVRKEACLKGTGEGLGDGLARYAVGPGPRWAPQWDGGGLPADELHGWAVTDLDAPTGAAAAVATAAPTPVQQERLRG